MVRLYLKTHPPTKRETNLEPPKRQWRTTTNQLRAFSLIGLLALLPHLVYAVPMMTNYQGYLANIKGNPLDAQVSMKFALYDTPVGGTPLWTETHSSVTITQGVFSVILGSVSNFNQDDFEGERYLGVTVGTDPEMSPRQILTSVALAIKAGVAESVAENAVTTSVIAEGAVTSDKVANNAITGEKIANFSGHSATALDDITSAGSGAIITAEERDKLQSLATSSGAFQLNGNDAYYTAGNVGIGTTTPSATLEVAGNVKAYGNLTAASVMSSNRHAIGLEYNILFNAENRYKVTQTGVPLNLGTLFDGIFFPSYTSEAPSKSNPTVVLIEELPDAITQAGAWIGWTTRLWPATHFKIEGFNIYTFGDRPYGWVTVADYSDGEGYGDYQYITKTGFDHNYIKLRFTFYQGGGLDGRFGISELFFIHPEANRPYSGLLPSTMWEVDGNVGIGTKNPQYKLDVAGTIRGNNVSPSDQRLKQNIQPLENVLTKVEQLRGVNFEWKDKKRDAGTQIGMIAQEVEKVLPELVSTDSEGYKSLAYDKMTAVLVEAVKELKAQNDALKAIFCEDHPEKAICQ
jgi:hypothetical protein